MFIMNGRTWPNEFTFQQGNDGADFKPRRSNCDTCFADKLILEHSHGKLKNSLLSDHKMIEVSTSIRRYVHMTQTMVFKNAYLKRKESWKIDKRQIAAYENNLRIDKKIGR